MVDLFPVPRHLEFAGSGAALHASVVEEIRPSIPAQGYELDVGPSDGSDGIVLRFSDADGKRYGTDTLNQLRESYVRESLLPGLLIRDWPDFEVRGYMLDVSRDRVPTMDTLFWLIDMLAKCRINQLQLYIEHTFAYRDHEVVWRDASPITAEEMRTLDARCEAQGIELVANLNCFGHMERWLKHDQYRDRAECPDGWNAPWGGVSAPATLEPSPANALFAIELVHEMTDCLSSRRVNIGCDETFELGLGRSSDAVAERGKAEVFVDHLNRISEPLIQDGLDVQFWGDMVRRDPSVVDRISSEATAIAWTYEAPGPADSGTGAFMSQLGMADVFELPEDSHLGFRAHARTLSNIDNPLWLAPGTSTWNSLIGDWSNAQANLVDAAKTGLLMGAEGILITDWGDNGHLQPLSISLPPMAFGGAVTWCAETNDGIDVSRMVDRCLVGDSTSTLGATLLKLGDVHRLTGAQSVNGTPLGLDVFSSPMPPVWGDPTEAGVYQVLDLLDDAHSAVSDVQPDCLQADEMRLELAAAIRLARHAALRIAWRNGLRSPTAHQMRNDLGAAIEVQKASWLSRSRPGGLSDSISKLNPTLDEYT